MTALNPSIYQIVYRSVGAIVFRDVEIKQILEEARARNSQNSITGILVLRGAHFLQLLEGEKAKVLETIRRIERDKRHRDIKVLLEGPSAARIFPKWTMGIVDEHTLAASTPEVLATIDRIVTSDGDFRQSILKVLKTFSTNEQALAQPLSQSISKN